MKSTINAQAARNTTVFVINLDGIVEETTLFDHIAMSAERTTTPRGIGLTLFISEDEDGTWQIKEWGLCGRGPAKLINTFATKEEAEDEWLDLVKRFDFAQDDQRDTRYYLTREEAERHLATEGTW